MAKYISTIIGVIVAGALFVTSYVIDVDLLELMVVSLKWLEVSEVDEVIIPFTLLLLFVLFDVMRWQKRVAVEAEKSKLYLSMIAAVHHILNNFINQMQYFKMEAEELDNFDKVTLLLYEDTLEEATLQVKKLSEIERLDAYSISEAVYSRKKHPLE